MRFPVPVQICNNKLCVWACLCACMLMAMLAVFVYWLEIMMTSSNGSICRVTGHLWGEFTGPGEFPTQRPVTRSFDVFFDLRLNKRLSKQSWGRWFETLSRPFPLWRYRNVVSPLATAVGGKMCLWDSGVLGMIPRSTLWSDSLRLDIFHAANAQGHVLVAPLCKVISICIFYVKGMLSKLQRRWCHPVFWPRDIVYHSGRHRSMRMQDIVVLAVALVKFWRKITITSNVLMPVNF